MHNASAAVAKDGSLPAVRTKEDLASAGRRKLEEFRNKRKNAAGAGARKVQAASGEASRLAQPGADNAHAHAHAPAASLASAAAAEQPSRMGGGAVEQREASLGAGVPTPAATSGPHPPPAILGATPGGPVSQPSKEAGAAHQQRPRAESEAVFGPGVQRAGMIHGSNGAVLASAAAGGIYSSPLPPPGAGAAVGPVNSSSTPLKAPLLLPAEQTGSEPPSQSAGVAGGNVASVAATLSREALQQSDREVERPGEWGGGHPAALLSAAQQGGSAGSALPEVGADDLGQGAESREALGWIAPRPSLAGDSQLHSAHHPTRESAGVEDRERGSPALLPTWPNAAAVHLPSSADRVLPQTSWQSKETRGPGAERVDSAAAATNEAAAAAEGTDAAASGQAHHSTFAQESVGAARTSSTILSAPQGPSEVPWEGSLKASAGAMPDAERWRLFLEQPAAASSKRTGSTARSQEVERGRAGEHSHPTGDGHAAGTAASESSHSPPVAADPLPSEGDSRSDASGAGVPGRHPAPGDFVATQTRAPWAEHEVEAVLDLHPGHGPGPNKDPAHNFTAEAGSNTETATLEHFASTPEVPHPQSRSAPSAASSASVDGGASSGLERGASGGQVHEAEARHLHLSEVPESLLPVEGQPNGLPPSHGKNNKRRSFGGALDRSPFPSWLTGHAPAAPSNSQHMKVALSGDEGLVSGHPRLAAEAGGAAQEEASGASAALRRPEANGALASVTPLNGSLNSRPFVPPAPPPRLDAPKKAGSIESASPLKPNGSSRQNGGHSLAVKAAPLAEADSTSTLAAAKDKLPGKEHLHPPAAPAVALSSDFGALEQHIEDLTQEKFALQRSLDAARALSESLAQENSEVTQDFNSRGALLAQLRGELEELRGELKASRTKLALAAEGHERALQERDGAQERSQALAAEVIALEERALRLRSRELKLEREMENLASELESQKRVMSTLEKDRANLRALVDGLQEEKRALQHRLRQAAVGSVLRDARPSSLSVPESPSQPRVDVATSTIDLAAAAPASSGGDAAPTAAAATPSSEPGATSAHHESHTSSSGAGSSAGPARELEVETAEREEGGPEPAQPRIEPSAVESAPPQATGHGPQAAGSPLPESSGGVPQGGAAPGSSSSSSEGRVAAAMAAAAMAAAAASAATPRGFLSGQHLSSPRALLPAARDALPEDELRCLDTIYAHIAKIGEEHQALARALEAEAAAAAELRASNMELSRKLAAQTQRLELAVTQNLLSASPRPPSQSPTTAAPSGPGGTDTQLLEYLDEGDEVVFLPNNPYSQQLQFVAVQLEATSISGSQNLETAVRLLLEQYHQPASAIIVAERVLGWILKLLPGGRVKSRPGGPNGRELQADPAQ